MNKVLLLAVAAVAALAMPVAAQGSAYGAGLWADVAPILALSGKVAEADGYEATPDDLYDYFTRPSFLSVGFILRAGPFSAAMSGELQQDIGEMLKGGELTNLPLTRDASAFLFSNNYPNVGYLEGSGKWWRLSLGRRAINIGPGIGSLTVSGDNPRYDHFGAGLSAPLGADELDYDFLAISVPRTGTSSNGKDLFYHRVSLDSSRFSIGLSEYNLVTGVAVDFEDFGPFLVFHHLFAGGSNVMAQLDLEWRPVANARAYAEMLMDDFQLAAEGSGSNPNAFGFLAGAQWRIADGVVMARPRYFRKDYLLDIGKKPLEGGLVATLEGYWASTYLYRRASGSADQAYATRYFMQTNSAWYEIPTWFSYPLGPDRILLRGNLSYSLRALSLSGECRLALLGAESGETTYDAPYAENWLGPQAPITARWDAVAGIDAALGTGTLATVRAGFSLLGDDPAVFTVTFGIVRRFAAGSAP